VFPDLTVLENLAVALQQPWRALLRRSLGHAERARADALLEEFGLTRVCARSGGIALVRPAQAARVRLVADGEPRLVLLDEPAAGVNPLMVEDGWSATSASCTRVVSRSSWSSTDMHLVMRLSETVIVLDHGTTIATGVPLGSKRDPRVLDAYLGVA